MTVQISQNIFYYFRFNAYNKYKIISKNNKNKNSHIKYLKNHKFFKYIFYLKQNSCKMPKIVQARVKKKENKQNQKCVTYF